MRWARKSDPDTGPTRTFAVRLKAARFTSRGAPRGRVHRLGYRFRLHVRALPGTPDIVLPRLRKIINVHGCFWHKHGCRHGRAGPAANASYWSAKRRRNCERDRRARRKLRRTGWAVLTVWECQMKDRDRLAARIAGFLAR